MVFFVTCSKATHAQAIVSLIILVWDGGVAKISKFCSWENLETQIYRAIALVFSFATERVFDQPK